MGKKYIVEVKEDDDGFWGVIIVAIILVFIFGGA